MRLLSFITIIVALSIGGFYALQSYQEGAFDGLVRRDTVSARRLPVPHDPEVIRLADESAMTEKAREIYYRSVPQIDGDRALFEAHCNLPNVPDSSIELACYAASDNRIFILRIDDPQLRSEMTVAAAHEMLHAAYAKMTPKERAEVDRELRASLPAVMNDALRAQLRQYRISEPGQENNELHSILGTEYRNLPPALETYYGQYFTDRRAVVKASEDFEGIFNKLKAEIQATEAQIRDLRRQMAEDRRLNNISAYNAKVARVNALVREYNDQVAKYNRLSRGLLGPELPEVPR